MKQPITG